MKYSLLLLFTFLCTCVSAQTVTGERTAELRPGDYAVTGSATLRTYDDGRVELALSEDFNTDAGPDVQLFLSNGRTRSGGLRLASLTGLQHFRGARTFAVPDTVSLADYSHVVMYCVAFNALWCFGEFSALPGPNQCTTSTVSTNDGLTQLDLCPADGAADVVIFSNNLASADTLSYAYLVTDANDNLLFALAGDRYDFEGSGPAEQRVYGIQYSGIIQPAVGANRRQTTATECFEHSADGDYLTITKGGCAPAFVCQPSLVATHAWVTNIDVCATDGQPDSVFMQNNIDVPAGDHYAFLLTDTNEVVLAVVQDSMYNFEGSGTDERRIYGLHFDGDLQPVIGQVRTATTATGCYEHSGGNIFMTINKTAACATSVADRGLAKQILVAPNPAREQVRLSWPADFAPTTVMIRDVNGRVLRAVTPGRGALTLALSGLAAGTYVVQLREEATGRFAVRRLVVTN